MLVRGSLTLVVRAVNATNLLLFDAKWFYNGRIPDSTVMTYEPTLKILLSGLSGQV